MAKSPTPIPAPPVKIQRGAPTNTPVKKRRRKKRVNPFVLLLRGLARRIYFGVKTAFKFLLLVPILVFMVAFSYNVDRSGLFQGALAPRRIVDLMLQGYDVTNFEQMDERQVVQLFAQDVPETPEAIGIGSSRVLQFNRENTGVESFFNMGVTGADVRDNMTSYYKMVTYGKAPRVLLWSLDPWVFYGSEAAFDARADADLYNEFLTKVLNVPTDYEEPDKVELWKALADPAYFQGNVDYYVKNRGQATVTDDEGNTIEFNPVQGDPYDQPTTIKRSDGSVLYDTDAEAAQMESHLHRPEVQQAMEEGKIAYAGKYSAPDYEQILAAGCRLAIENTMIYHTPEVKEQLEKLGIPVFVERSSYEPHALGRMEWIKVYGTLLGCEDKAEKLFADKVDGIVDILQKPAAGKTVSFFYITSNGAANVRKSTDYIAEMISLAGGKYIFDDLTDDTAKSTVNMQMESFYAGAKDADVMIYNATIDSELQTLDQLLEKSPLLADFKAVKTGNVWCTEKNLYQSTMELDELIRDFHTVIADGDPSTLKYLHKLS